MKIFVGMPAFNEEKNIGPLIVNIMKNGYGVIVCDDASTDSTSMIAEKLGAIVVKHSQNLGYGAAIQSIFTKARQLESDILVTLDADGQHDYNDIKSIVQPIIDHKSDLVIGSRFLDKKSDIPKYREIGIKTLTKIANVSQDSNLTDSQSGFRAYNKKCVDLIHPSENGMGVSVEILMQATQNNLKISEVSIVVSYEGDTSTHNPAVHGLSVFGTTFKIISIKHPLLFYGIPGLFFFGMGLLFTILTVSSFVNTRTIITNQALLAVGSIVIGLVLMMTATILFSVVNVVRERR